MRLLLTAAVAAATIAFAAPQTANASENRISVHEVHALVDNINKNMNNRNLSVGRDFLNRLISENASFDNNMNIYSPQWQAQPVWYGQYANPYYYRYPYATAYKSHVSTKTLSKWEEIGQFENKKRLIPGYQSQMAVTDINMNSYARSAVIDVDMKEYSTGYNPYDSRLTGKILHANSKCKLYVTKSGQDLTLTRMDCNTNTSLPL